jgi:rod shape-determining protein MreC
MGVINSLGIVGIITPNYATVISILNKKSQINAKIKKSNHFGSLIWNGKSTGFVQLVDVPRLAAIRKETPLLPWTICNFPENIIGTIDKIE